MQQVQWQASQGQGASVEVLEAEAVGILGAAVRTRLQPGALTDLVGRGLAGPTEVPVQFEACCRLVHGGVVVEEPPGLVPGPFTTADLGRGLELAVQADVEHDASCTQGLPVQQPHEVARIVHVPQIGHEPLGVQCPPLDRTGLAGKPPPRVEGVLLGDG